MRLAADADRAGVRLVVAADDLDERRLPGAVLAEEGEHATTGGRHAHLMEDLDTAERLA